MNYECIIVGGGHAGCEAALACARTNHKTLLITGSIDNIATMPCNPSIGGSAKGIVVREIDALGGEMGKNADKTLIQIKMLNSSKGPAVHSLRAQADKITYPKEMLKTLQSTKNLEIKEGIVEDLIIEENIVKGVVLEDGLIINSIMVILTTGTYLKSDILIGSTRKRSGPHGEKPSNHLSDNLKKYGFNILRLKTGTPPRIKKSSINFSNIQVENGDLIPLTFSHDNIPSYDANSQVPCYLLYTNELTHKIIKENLNKSSMYGGLNDITGVGPRYCPSIEDKIMRFKDKERHQLFLEPESLYYDDIYLQGFSTSMSEEVQEKMVHSLEGLEKAEIIKYAYAIEYDAIYPTQIKNTLETKTIKNLWTAGQINGTSGYEEAAAQGLMAGINASLKLDNKKELILKRNESYIGVLIDDLTTKGTIEPYRLLTSRAEYRLLLRNDNADLRLREYGYQVGLINSDQYQKFIYKKENISKLIDELKNTKITTRDNAKLKELNTHLLKNGINIYELLKRPEITINKLKELNIINIKYTNEVENQAEIQIKYEGYINKVQKEVDKILKYENKLIPSDIDYNKVKNLASEARQKLNTIRPESIGRALRISGVNPSDISILMIYLKRLYNE